MTDEELIQKLVDLYREQRSKLKCAELYMGYHKNTKYLKPVDLKNLDYYNDLLKPYNLKMELDPDEKNSFCIFESSYDFNPPRL